MRYFRCSRQWNDKTWYAQNLPWDGGKDWGYTNDPKEALPLSTYWMRRFVANAKACSDRAAPGVFELPADDKAAA